MRLSEKQMQFALRRVNEKRSVKTCPVCVSNAPFIMEPPYELREYNGGTLLVGGASIMPILPLTCDNCGYTQLFNAIKLGLVDPNSGGFLGE